MTWPLEKMTAQEVFDTVTAHLLTQKECSKNANGNCAYRGLNGLKCAAGCLIPDECYNPDMEGSNWGTLIGGGFGVPEVHRNLIARLQTIHDNCPVETWYSNLKELANSKGLSFNFKDN
jgi:hypothetical protein